MAKKLQAENSTSMYGISVSVFLFTRAKENIQETSFVPRQAMSRKNIFSSFHPLPFSNLTHPLPKFQAWSLLYLLIIWV
jgi:hypothetical protein